MTDLHPPTAPPRVRAPETWEKIRAAYLAGEPAAAVAEAFGVSLSSLRARAAAEGWRRQDQAEPPPDWGHAEDDLDEGPLPEPGELADLARRRAATALRRGRVLEAERWTRVHAAWRRLAREDAAPPPPPTPIQEASKAAREQIEARQLELLTRIARQGQAETRLLQQAIKAGSPMTALHAVPPDAPVVLDGLDSLDGADAPPPDLTARLAELDRRIADLDARRLPATHLRRERHKLRQALARLKPG